MKKKSIAIIDDDKWVMNYYIEELILNGYNAQIFNSVNKFFPTLSPNSNIKFDLFIVDIMMPPGKKYSMRLTKDGLYTGIFLAQDIRMKFMKIPIILLSNQTLESVRDRAKQLSEKLDNCISLNKLDTQPYKLIEIVDRYFQELKLRPKDQQKILNRLYNGLLIEPNFFGIGIDVKKLFSTKK